jgi:DNA-binding IclR family transcriptional regulator
MERPFHISEYAAPPGDPTIRAMSTSTQQTQGSGPRLLRLLQAIAAGEREFALKDAAARTRLPPSTVHRLLAFLVKADMVERAGPRLYRIGAELFRVAALIEQKFDVQRIARPYLQELWTQWQETCSFCLYMPATRSASVVETLRSPHPLQFVIEPHSEVSLAWGSMGCSILAFLPKNDVEAVLSRDRRGPLSGKQLPSRKTFRQELEAIRKRGIAVYEDRSLNIAGVTAPVFGTGGNVIGSIGVTMPASRFRESARAEMCDSVLLRAQRLSEAVGHRAVR